jgi:dTDP-glucose 4,6-dehydratase
VLGGGGFIGSNFVNYMLKKRDINVINIDKISYSSNLKFINKHIHKNYFFYKTNISNKKKIQYILNKHTPYRIINFAAYTHVDNSIDNERKFIENNILSLQIFLDTLKFYLKKKKLKNFKFHHISTDEVFGSLSNDANIKFTENTPYDPRSPYSASKASSDHLVRAWHSTYKLPIVLTNCSNNYGPYHFPEKLIPVVILNALENKPIPIYGDGTNIRDWLYVEDHADALLLAIEKGIIGRSYNVGGNNEISNIDLVEAILNILDNLRPRKNGLYKDLITFVDDRPGHDERYAIDSSRIQKELGWKPSVNLQEGLKKTVLWYLNNEKWWRPLLNRKDVGIRHGVIE